MSRGNIADMIPDASGLTVTFNCRNGEQRSYHYSLSDGLEILGGSDPADFAPDGGGPGIGGDVVMDIGEALLDAGELGAL